VWEGDAWFSGILHFNFLIMANYAQNIVEVRFLRPPELLAGEELVSRFVSQFDCDDIY